MLHKVIKAYKVVEEKLDKVDEELYAPEVSRAGLILACYELQNAASTLWFTACLYMRAGATEAEESNTKNQRPVKARK